ncbi:MAG: Asp-tRNA(Asn)/Glu-tRNA(Gln) amidotransferase subunit GatB [Dehalococcoidia bacterium]|nr:Asp-tRNA(Asn)/Glu-tRNA(Gln) amidotransferase subunit GatB [Dehalococcoidia bacterium]
MEYETVIGLEVHAQVITKSKMFCPCSSNYSDASPNTHVCPICLGMPGVLPVINEEAVRATIMTGLALNCTISENSKFDRKNYPYPDLMKGYQISQYDEPFCKDGWMIIEVDGVTKRAGITRVHLEEDTAKLSHHNAGEGESYSLVDVNRSSVPLMEIVGEPDLRCPEDARQYLIKLRRILQYLGVSTGNMEEGSFRCDANISLRPRGSTELGSRAEVKNMNSFRAVFRALEYEEKRQKELLDSGRRPAQETRGWVEESGTTASQRSKEFAHDYRYFPEPDLPMLSLSREYVENVRASLPELPDARRERLISTYGMSEYDSSLITGSKALAEFFDACMASKASKPAQAATKQRAKTVSNWLIGDVSRLLNLNNLEINHSKLTPQHLTDLLDCLDGEQISGTVAKKVLEEMFHSGKNAAQVIDDEGLSQIGGETEIIELVEKVLAAQPQAVADYNAGKQQAIGFLVGQVMRESKGRANVSTVTDILRDKLSAPAL